MVGTLAFSIEIYCDFSGYTDIARGAARVMGFRLMHNFDSPYASRTIGEFWRRWHISLSTWFRDYVYIPLGGNRHNNVRNILAVFLLSGLWHGANWTFVWWGGLHAFYLLMERSRLRAPWPMPPPVQEALATIRTFVLVTVAWVFFRASSVSQAFYILAHLGSGWLAGNVDQQLSTLGWSGADWFGVLMAIGILETVQWWQRQEKLQRLIVGRPLWLRWSLYYSICSYILTFGETGGKAFVYFQF
jgi:D-alanyl-lipoteichoic acid acyltransferase DltB (MBOAT superfamily)